MKTLEIDQISLQFGGVQVLKNISFSVEQNQLLALIGPNGAGKTTVLNCISGILKYDGRIVLEGRSITGRRPAELAFLGVARTFQHAELAPEMTVQENLLVARHSALRNGVFSELFNLPSHVREEAAHVNHVQEILKSVGLSDTLHRLISDLPFGVQKVVGFARALALSPKILLLDEPSAGLTGDERADMTRFIKEVKQRFKVSTIWIEHDIKMVGEIADKVVVLDYGRLLADGLPDVVLNDPEVIKAYLGTGIKLKKMKDLHVSNN